MSAHWTGPLETDLASDGESLRAPVPPERWPYGPPSHHEAADDAEWGAGGWPIPARQRP